MRIYFLGLIKFTRSYYWLYFYVFFRVIKPIRKSSQRSILPFLSSVIKMKEQKKSGGFMHNIFYAIVYRVIFKLGTHLVGYPLPPSHVLPMSLYTPPTGYSSDHPWRLVFVLLSQCCQVILSNVAISLKIVCLESISYIVLCTISHVLVLLWSLKSSTLISCRLMKDASMPSFDIFHPADFNTLFRIEI